MPLEHLALALAPVLVLLVLLNWRGRPLLPVLAALGLGVACSELAGVVENLLTLKQWSITNFGMLFLFATIVAGVVEELCKFAAFRVGPGQLSWFRFREEYDGILYACVVSLGFAGWENVLYVSEHGWDTGVLRAFTAVPAHAICGVIMGVGLGQARVRELRGWSQHGLAVRGVWYAILFHGFYDTLAFSASPVAQYLLYGMVAGGALWSVRAVLQARRRSPSFGGTEDALPRPVGAVVLPLGRARARRNPSVAALLGGVPGLGQAYNGEYARGAVMMAIFVINVALVRLLDLFIENPLVIASELAQWGVTVALTSSDVTALVNNRGYVMGFAVAMLAAWCLLSAVDAWRGADGEPRPMLDGLGKSYLAHVALILVVLFTPILAGGRPANAKGDEGGYNVTWVENPTTIDGWKNPSEGTGDGKGQKEREQRPGAQGQGDEGIGKAPSSPQTSTSDDKAPGEVADRSDPEGRSGKGDKDRKSGDPNATAEGVGKSYNQYITSKFHHGIQSTYFDNVPKEVWTVVRYYIDADGTLHDVTVMDTSGTDEQAQYAVKAVNQLVPLKPLPEKVTGIEVTELFWSSATERYPPGTLHGDLSQLPDGRRIKVIF